MTLACMAFVSRSDGVIRRGHSSYCKVLHCTDHTDPGDMLDTMLSADCSLSFLWRLMIKIRDVHRVQRVWRVI